MITKEELKQHIQDSCELRNIEPGVNEAMAIASMSLLEDRDKAGADYAIHWVTVAFDGTHSHIKQQIGILHDVIEDTDWNIDDLKSLNFDSRVVSGVAAMTRDELNDEDYFTFVERCSLDKNGLDVKLNDLRHNQNKSRNNFIAGEKDLMREVKYTIAYQYLLAVKKGKIDAGSPVENFAMNFFGNDENYDQMRPVFEKEDRHLPSRPASAKAKFGGLNNT